MENQKVVVIGAGISGLATAALLGKNGYKVTILEKNEVIGGRAMVFRESGFTFDMGPSWYTMPEIFDRYFSLFNKKTSDYYILKKLDPQLKAFYSPSQNITIPGSLEGAVAALETLDPGIAPRFYSHLEKSGYIKEKATGDLLYKSYDSISQLIMPGILLEGKKLGIYESLHSEVAKITSDPKVQQLLEFHAMFLGCSPYNIPALYSLMDSVIYNDGVFYPMGGMYKIISALEKLCIENKCEIKTAQNIKKIAVTAGNAKSVITEEGGVYSADIVVSSADYPFTELKLLDNEWCSYPASYWEKKTVAPSAFIIYLGIKGKINTLAHHSIYFSSHWKSHFDSIFTNPDWPNDPSYYIGVPSKTDSSIVPEDSESVFILVPVAPGLVDSDEVCDYFEKKILNHFSSLIGESLNGRIVVKHILSSRDYSALYNAYQGTAFGLSHTRLQTAMFRPSIKSKKVGNLYYTGQYLHPGIGVPMCLISAELTAGKITNDKRK